jgi:ribonuclease P/MRP protein subunit POP1
MYLHIDLVSVFHFFRYINGSRVCETELFDDAAYPLDFIAPVQVLWQTQVSSSKNQPKSSEVSIKGDDPVVGQARVAWLRVHPAAYEKSSKALTAAAMAVLESEKQSGHPSIEIEIADLRGQFNSFNLTGPKSSQVIWGALSPVKEHTVDTKKHVRVYKVRAGGH